MHQSSLENMMAFRDKYLGHKENDPLLILDLGSLDVNGSYKKYFDQPSWRYVGLDLSEGKNVDIVLKSPYRWNEIKSNSADVFISGQAFEHIEFFWLTILEISRVLKTGGLCCLIAPAGGYEHRYPVDCWRFYPDGFDALARFGLLKALEIYSSNAQKTYPDESSLWKDTVLIARKPAFNWVKKLKLSILYHLLYSVRLA